MYQHAKNEAVSSIYSGETLDLKILRSDWLKAFWSISQEQDFSQIYDLRRNTVNNNIFYYRTSSVKINDQIFLQIQKNLFLVHFPNFWDKKCFFKELGCHAQLHKGFQHHTKIQKI